VRFVFTSLLDPQESLCFELVMTCRPLQFGDLRLLVSTPRNRGVASLWICFNVERLHDCA
jgi:hypothetical protein